MEAQLLLLLVVSIQHCLAEEFSECDFLDFPMDQSRAASWAARLVVGRDQLEVGEYLRVTLKSTIRITGFRLKATMEGRLEEDGVGTWYLPYLPPELGLTEAEYLSTGVLDPSLQFANLRNLPIFT